MERMTRFRATLLVLLVCIILGFFSFKLYDEQIIKTGGVIDNTTTFTTMTRVKAARGDILDRNGNLLVSNRASYDLVVNHFVLNSSNKPNEALLRLVNLCKERGIEYADHFPVSRTKPFVYTMSDLSSAWQNYFKQYLAERGNLDSDITADLLLSHLRKSYFIPDDWPDEQARAVIGLRYEMSLRSIVNLPNYIFLEDASDEDLAAIKELNIPGMNVEASTVREYNTTYAAHLLGYVGAMSGKQWEYYKTLDGYSMDAQVGQSGLEQAFEEELHGVDGWRVDVVTKDGTIVESYWRNGQPPKAGNNVEVSIDLNLQIVAENALEDTIVNLKAQEKENADGKDVEGGAVVVMDVKTGEILVSASYPSYNPDTFFDDYTELEKDPMLPLVNRALDFAYPPGSTYKMTMVIAAMEEGKIVSGTPMLTKGIFDKYKDKGFTGYCLEYTTSGRTHGEITASQALSVSCNWFFFQLGDWLENDQSDPYAKAMGFGESTGVELYENKGYRLNLATKKRLYKGVDANTVYVADRLQSAIGQGDNRVTPLQLCVYASTLANKGTRYRATFMNRVVSADYRSLISENKPEVMSVLEISDETYQTYVEGMKLVAREGTGRRTFATYPLDIACKTGTAETGLHIGSDNGAFVAFAPANNPQIAVSVYVERAGHGSTVAGIAKEIFDSYFDVDEVGEVVIYENTIS